MDNPANRALAYSENLQYSLLEIEPVSHFKGKKIVVATDLVNSVTEKCNLKNFKILKNFHGKFLKDTICEHPFNKLGFDYNVPLLDANFVNLEQGTGLVHCAPSHGPDDLIFA